MFSLEYFCSVDFYILDFITWPLNTTMYYKWKLIKSNLLAQIGFSVSHCPLTQVIISLPRTSLNGDRQEILATLPEDRNFTRPLSSCMIGHWNLDKESHSNTGINRIVFIFYSSSSKRNIIVIITDVPQGTILTNSIIQV